jgi:hypothetical protein
VAPAFVDQRARRTVNAEGAATSEPLDDSAPSETKDVGPAAVFEFRFASFITSFRSRSWSDADHDNPGVPFGAADWSQHLSAKQKTFILRRRQPICKTGKPA